MADPGIVPASVILQLTDLHIGPVGSLPYGVDTADHLRQVARAVRESEIDPDVVLLTGDLTDEGDAASYEHLRTLVTHELEPIGAPVLAVVGNHDHRDTFRQVYLGEADGSDDDPYHHVHDFDVSGARIAIEFGKSANCWRRTRSRRCWWARALGMMAGQRVRRRVAATTPGSGSATVAVPLGEAEARRVVAALGSAGAEVHRFGLDDRS